MAERGFVIYSLIRRDPFSTELQVIPLGFVATRSFQSFGVSQFPREFVRTTGTENSKQHTASKFRTVDYGLSLIAPRRYYTAYLQRADDDSPEAINCNRDVLH